MWGPPLSPNTEYLKLWGCVRAVTLRFLTMAEFICIQFKYFLGISFLSELGLPGTTKMESIHRNRSIFRNIGFPIRIEENDAGLGQMLMKQIYDETERRLQRREANVSNTPAVATSTSPTVFYKPKASTADI